MTHATLPALLRQKALGEIKDYLAEEYQKVHDTAPAPDATCLNQAADLWLDQMLDDLATVRKIPDFDTIGDVRMQQVILFEYLKNRARLQLERIKAAGIGEATALLISDGLRLFSASR